jgi:hypothetical protein
MEKIVVSPEQSDYSFTDGEEVVAIPVEGGAARYRKDIINSHIRVRASWVLDPPGYHYIRAFYRATQNGGLPFLIDLIVNSSTLTQHTAYFLPGTMSLSSKEGNIYHVSAELEADPVPNSLSPDGLVVLNVGAYTLTNGNYIYNG